MAHVMHTQILYHVCEYYLHRMGPLHLADYVGLDTCLFIMEGWVKDFPDERAFVVPEILREKVKKNELGRKTGKGFYNWDGDKRGDPIEL
mmetsp:Transcript_32557/g.70296  ORF Transcript_32557/g.70296 Transcript_32557/m.70296 type:complete len:90 (+) Transcript_32557:1053-1322(+)